MRRYGRPGVRRGVSHYEMGPGFIHLRFGTDPRIYVYDDERPGRGKVMVMQHLAVEGEGLTTFINQHVRGDYARWIVPSTSEQ